MTIEFGIFFVASVALLLWLMETGFDFGQYFA
jgi:hypothetical protein